MPLKKLKFIFSNQPGVLDSGEIKTDTADIFVGFSAIFTTEDKRQKASYIYVKELREEIQKILDRYPGSTLAMQYQKTIKIKSNSNCPVASYQIRKYGWWILWIA